MRYPPAFYRTAAVASWLSALTTLALIFLPSWYPAVNGFDDRMALVHDPFYAARSWIYLLHPFLVFTAALGIAMRVRHAAPAWMLAILAGFGIWAATEALQQCMTLLAFDRWRVAYATADAAFRAAMVERAALYDAVWDAMYFLLLIGFAIGNFAAAMALRGRGRFGNVVAAFYVAACLLTLTLISGEAGGPRLPATLGFWIYPLTQPLARALIGAWLWRHADEQRDLT